jgi:8-oxo-dGTP pyrophosphatase MutT (NUDIX family)
MTPRNASADIGSAPRRDSALVRPAPEDWIARLRARLDPPDQAAAAPALTPDPDIDVVAEAAVLAPLVLREGALHVILTVRPEGMPRHPGQISFPGGRLHGSESAAAAALRETHEEIGVAPHHIDLLGGWEPIVTISGMRVTPFAGLVHAEAAPCPCPREVAELFTAPLDFLMDPANHVQELREWRGRTRPVTAIPYGAYHIWGATAAMLRALSERIARTGEDQ